MSTPITPILKENSSCSSMSCCSMSSSSSSSSLSSSSTLSVSVDSISSKDSVFCPSELREAALKKTSDKMACLSKRIEEFSQKKEISLDLAFKQISKDYQDNLKKVKDTDFEQLFSQWKEKLAATKPDQIHWAILYRVAKYREDLKGEKALSFFEETINRFDFPESKISFLWAIFNEFRKSDYTDFSLFLNHQLEQQRQKLDKWLIERLEQMAAS